MTSANSKGAALRPLPARPDLEFEKERAKKMVREGVLKLADAQLMIAREYGFGSWRNLLAYYKTWELHERSGTTGWGLTEKSVNAEVARLLESANHPEVDARPLLTGTAPSVLPLTPSQLAAVATFVPRFYGLTNSEIRASVLSEGEAQFVVARLRRFSSWQALLDRLKEVAPLHKDVKHQGAPLGFEEAKEAIRNRDGDALVKILQTYPDCFCQPSLVDSLRIGPVWEIITQFMKIGDAGTRALLDRLSLAGVNIQQHLNSELLGGPFFRIPTEQIRALLELGADPSWLPPTGANILEYAIVRYMNGEAVDLIAERVKPRKSFWIAAGLGDVATMRTFMNKRGQLTSAARHDRPDALMLGVLPSLTRAQRPEVIDLEILSEAFFFAGLNNRFAAMQELLDLGVSMDYAPGLYSLLSLAIANDNADLANFLLAQDADTDYKVRVGVDSARDIAIRMNIDITRMQKSARAGLSNSR